MDKKYGMSSQLHGYIWKDINEELDNDGVIIKVHDGLIEVLYDNGADHAKANRLTQAYLDAYTFRTGNKVTIDFNHTWENKDHGAKDHSINLSNEVHLSERLQIRVNQATIKGTARIVTQDMHDSASFSNDSLMVNKALADQTLGQALSYYSREVVDADRPLIGVYKAIEVITKHIGSDGRAKLGVLASQSKSYVDDLMQSTQLTRHAATDAQVKLSDEECKQRAKILIEAYADSLKPS